MNELKLNYELVEMPYQFDEMIDLVIGTMMSNPTLEEKLINKFKNTPLKLRDAIFWDKFYGFVSGIRNVVVNIEVLGDENARKKNVVKLLACIDHSDSDVKMGLIINITKVLFANLISIDRYFAIVEEIVENSLENILYLQEIVAEKKGIEKNDKILALLRLGVVEEMTTNGFKESVK